MPLYEYECDACGQRFEQIRKFADPPLEVCAKCGKGPLRKLPSSPAIQFKGQGWYITDYAKKSSPDSSSSKPGSGESSAETKKSETPAASPTTSDKSDKKN